MAEPRTIEDLEFEVTSENTDDTPEFSIEDLEEHVTHEPEFSLNEDGDLQDEPPKDSVSLVDTRPETENAASTEVEISDYSDDILSQPAKAPSFKENDANSPEVDSNIDESIDVEVDSELAITHSPGTLHAQQAHQLEMSLLARIDDLIHTLQKRNRPGTSPEQLPHKQFATGLHYIKHEANHYLGAKWLRKAAMQGHAKAQLYLGMLFLQGNGVPKSLFHAYAWFSLAVCQNIPEAKDARKKLERHLTAKEINASLKYAADLLDKIHQP